MSLRRSYHKTQKTTQQARIAGPFCFRLSAHPLHRCLEASMKRAKEYELPMRSVKRCCSNKRLRGLLKGTQRPVCGEFPIGRTAWPRSSRRSLTRQGVQQTLTASCGFHLSSRFLGRLQPLWLLSQLHVGVDQRGLFRLWLAGLSCQGWQEPTSIHRLRPHD